MTTMSQPASAEDARALDAQRLLEMSPAALDALFRASPAGAIPSGRGDGTVVLPRHGGGEAVRPGGAFGDLAGQGLRPATRDLRT